jgi:uncharacterized cofD-like protein
MNHARTKSKPGRFSVWLKKYTIWLTPGLGVKRWFLLILLGITLLSVGLGVLLLEIYRTAPDTWWLPILSTASLRFLPRLVRVLIFGSLGLGLVAVGFWELNRSLVKPLIRPGHALADTLRLHRQRERGPRIVAIGGGHGLATLLRGLKNQSNNITAIVTVADDGGSSGRIRRDIGILPPGDIRNCLAALSDDEALMAQLFQYRFPDGEAGLDGHSFGNLFITALAEITGSFEAAVAESGRVLAVRGRVLPSTLHDVRLSADVRIPHAVNEVRVQGESQIPKSNGRVHHVWLEPSNPPAFPQAIQAILAADLIVIGPGSLYTSILPNLLVPDLTEAVRASRALKLFICNVATERGETNGYSAGDHIRTVEEHTSPGLFDIAVVNSNYTEKPPNGVDWVRVENDLSEDYRIYQADLVDALYPWRHDSDKLSRAVMDLYQERTGPLVESATNSN